MVGIIIYFLIGYFVWLLDRYCVEKGWITQGDFIVGLLLGWLWPMFLMKWVASMYMGEFSFFDKRVLQNKEMIKPKLYQIKKEK